MGSRTSSRNPRKKNPLRATKETTFGSGNPSAVAIGAQTGYWGRIRPFSSTSPSGSQYEPIVGPLVWLNATMSSHTSELVAFFLGTDTAPEGTLGKEGPGEGRREIFPSRATLRHDAAEGMLMVQGIFPRDTRCPWAYVVGRRGPAGAWGPSRSCLSKK